MTHSRKNVYSYPPRTVCAVLDDMRKCSVTGNFSYLPGLVEEMQCLGNTMEAALSMKGSIAEWAEDYREAKKDIKELYKEYNELLEQKETLDETK